MIFMAEEIQRTLDTPCTALVLSYLVEMNSKKNLEEIENAINERSKLIRYSKDSVFRSLQTLEYRGLVILDEENANITPSGKEFNNHLEAAAKWLK